MAALLQAPGESGVYRAAETETPFKLLLRAVRDGEEEIVERLLLHGASDPSGADGYGNTALHYACFHGLVNIVQILRGAGADASLRNHVGNTILHLAAENGQGAACRAAVECCGVPVDVTNDQQQSALHIASLLGHADAVSELLQLGADASLRSGRDQTAHDLAAQNGHDAVCALLSNAGESSEPTAATTIPIELQTLPKKGEPARTFCTFAILPTTTVAQFVAIASEKAGADVRLDGPNVVKGLRKFKLSGDPEQPILEALAPAAATAEPAAQRHAETSPDMSSLSSTPPTC